VRPVFRTGADAVYRIRHPVANATRFRSLWLGEGERLATLDEAEVVETVTMSPFGIIVLEVTRS
jgi:hypothetical protein